MSMIIENAEFGDFSAEVLMENDKKCLKILSTMGHEAVVDRVRLTAMHYKSFIALQELSENFDRERIVDVHQFSALLLTVASQRSIGLAAKKLPILENVTQRILIEFVESKSQTGTGLVERFYSDEMIKFFAIDIKALFKSPQSDRESSVEAFESQGGAAGLEDEIRTIYDFINKRFDTLL